MQYEQFLWALHKEDLLLLPPEKRHFLLFRVFLDSYFHEELDPQDTLFENGLQVFETPEAMLVVCNQAAVHYIVQANAFKPRGCEKLLKWWLSKKAIYSVLAAIYPENAHAVRRLCSELRTFYIDYVSLRNYEPVV